MACLFRACVPAIAASDLARAVRVNAIAVRITLGTPLRSDYRRMSMSLAISRRTARLAGIKFLEGVFLPDQAGEFGERVIASAQTRISPSLMRLRLRLPVAP